MAAIGRDRRPVPEDGSSSKLTLEEEDDSIFFGEDDGEFVHEEF